MKQKFRNRLHLSDQGKKQLGIINDIIEEYATEGYRLTLRQLYYQLVSREIISNQLKEYAKLSTFLVKGRMAGVVDWEAIEDRIRVPFIPYWVQGLDDAIDDTIEQYRLNRQKGQEVYIELWVEKDALSGVLKRITSYYHVYLVVNRGYSSCTAMYDAYKRFREKEREGKRIVVLYLGDYDPSGLDMIRDIRDRFREFGVNPEVRPIGLTIEQIRRFNPPPNPTKIKDPRAKWYIEKYGDTSWEVDALNPRILHQVVKENVEGLIDIDLFHKQLRQEEKDKEKLKGFVKGDFELK